MMNLFRSEPFIFDNPAEFPERMGTARYFAGEGEPIPMRPDRHMWETNFVADLGQFALQVWNERGTGSKNMMLILAEGTMHAHVSEIPVGRYKKAHRDVRKGGRQIEYEAQHPRVHALYLEELPKAGIALRMAEVLAK